jgi:hypothetical protein
MVRRQDGFHRDLIQARPKSVEHDVNHAETFAEEHQTVQELKSVVAEQQRQIEALTTGLQKVGAQLELSKPAPQTVLNHR